MQFFKVKRAFSLVEMLFVVSILTVLLGIAIPYVEDSITTARGRTSSQNLSTIEEAKKKFFVDHPWLTMASATNDLLPYLKYGVPAPAWPDEVYLNVLDLSKITASSVNGLPGHEPVYGHNAASPLANGLNDLGPGASPALQSIQIKTPTPLNSSSSSVPSGSSVWTNPPVYKQNLSFSVDSGAGGSVQMSLVKNEEGDDEEGDSSHSFISPATPLISPGSSVRVRALPDSGFIFNGWSNNGISVGQSSEFTSTMPSAPVSVYASFISRAEVGSVWATPTTQNVSVGDPVSLSAFCDETVKENSLTWTTPDLDTIEAQSGKTSSLPAIKKPGQYNYVLSGNLKEGSEKVTAKVSVTATNEDPILTITAPSVVAPGANYNITAKIQNYRSVAAPYNWSWQGSGSLQSSTQDSQTYQDSAGSISGGSTQIYSSSAKFDGSGNLIVPKEIISLDSIASQPAQFSVVTSSSNNLSVVSASTNTLTLSSTTLQEGEPYSIYYTVPPGADYAVVYSADVTDAFGGNASASVAVTVSSTNSSAYGAPSGGFLQPPNNLSALPGDGMAHVSWSVPFNPTTNSSLSYQVYVNNQFYTNVTGTNATIMDLVDGSTYTITVASSAGTNTSAPSSSVSVMPKGAPTSPSGIIAVPGDGRLTISWGSPLDEKGSAVTSYGIYINDSLYTNVSGDTTSIQIPGLTNGSYYTIGIYASNSIGASSLLTNIAVPYTYSTPPQNIKSAPGNNSLTIQWDPPSNTGGSPISSYQVNLNGKSYDVGTNNSYTFSGLINGAEYEVSVGAMNGAGWSSLTPGVLFSPYTTPSPITQINETLKNGSASFYWTPVSDDGGSSLTSYVVNWGVGTITNIVTNSSGSIVTNTISFQTNTFPISLSQPLGSATLSDGSVVNYNVDTNASTNSVVLTGLTNGLVYNFSIAPQNKAGSAPLSVVTNVAPVGYPLQPTLSGVSIINSNTVSVGWALPSSDQFDALYGTSNLVAEGGSPLSGIIIYNDSQQLAIASPTTNAYQLTNLDPSKTYFLNITSANSSGYQSRPTDPFVLSAAPLITNITSSNASITFNWSPPSGISTNDILGYKIYSSGVALSTSPPTSFASTISGLTNGITTTLQVSALTKSGEGFLSSPVFGVPSTIPSSPLNFSASPSNCAAGLAWQAPSSDGGSQLLGYEVYLNGNKFFVGDDTNVTTLSVPGLTNGTKYSFGVSAYNSQGASPLSTVDVTPFTIPGPPRNIAAVGSDSALYISWESPLTNGGSSILSYSTYLNGVFYSSTTSTNINIDNLLNGTNYTVGITALNASGESQVGTITSFPFTIPGPVSVFSATPTNQGAILAWQQPLSDGGSPISGYVIYIDGAPITNVNATSYSLSSLSNGTTYKVSVSAKNSAGESLPSTELDLTPKTTPLSPSSLRLASLDGQLGVRWSPPPDSGGSTILGYNVYVDGNKYTNVTVTEAYISNLVNGQNYSVAVSAFNDVGEGPTSLSATGTPNTAPSTPINVVATPGALQLTVTWDMPSGSTVPNSYSVYVDGSLYGVVSNNRCLVSGLTYGRLYRITISATNFAGSSPQSAPITAAPTAP